MLSVWILLLSTTSRLIYVIASSILYSVLFHDQIMSTVSMYHILCVRPSVGAWTFIPFWPEIKYTVALLLLLLGHFLLGKPVAILWGCSSKPVERTKPWGTETPPTTPPPEIALKGAILLGKGMLAPFSFGNCSCMFTATFSWVAPAGLIPRDTFAVRKCSVWG